MGGSECPATTLDASISSPADLVDWLSEAAAPERVDAVRHHCARVLLYSRHHWLEFGAEHYDRQRLSAAMEHAFAKAVQEWTDSEAELAFLLSVLGYANVGLDEVEHVLCDECVSDVVDHRCELYQQALGSRGHDEVRSFEVPLMERAHALRGLRAAVDAGHYRYSVIDGERWYRTERLLPKADVDLDAIPDGLARTLALPGTDRTALRAACKETIAGGMTLDSIMADIVRFGLADPALGVDYLTLVAPRQLGKVPEEDLHRRENIYYRTEVREGLDLTPYAEQLHHTSPDRMRRVIAARMQVLKLKAARQFFGSGCTAGEAEEKKRDYMIFFNEDAHYPGHQNAGCSTGGRSPIPIDFERNGVRHSYPGVFADLRGVRLSHEEAKHFAEADLARVIQYAAWIGVILMCVFEAGLAIAPDEVELVGV